jgi:transcriptional regulator with XRE-family HTH domain
MLGSRIRQARKIAGLTQEQLAEKADINRVTVAVLESGKNAPSAETLWRIAQATGQTVDWFHDGTAEEMAPPPAPAAQPTPQPDMPPLLAQLVAAQVRQALALSGALALELE